MPKSSKATAATKATFTGQEVHQLFNTKQTSLWEEGVEYLCSQHQIENYIRFLTNSVGEADKWVAEFSALVDYLGRKLIDNALISRAAEQSNTSICLIAGLFGRNSTEPLDPHTMSFGFKNPKPPPRPPSPVHAPLRGVTFTILIVGPQHEYFHVHRNRLDASSVWFTKISASGFEETAIQRTTLPEDDPSIVHLFVQWLYDPDPTFSVYLDEYFMQLARLFEFAQRLFIRQLKNYVIWQLYNLRSKNHIPPIPVVKFIFENLPDDSPFREVLVAWYTWHRDSACVLLRSPKAVRYHT
jgi:hypothetical protein